MVRFDWDAQKNARNEAKHGIDFETAQFIFDDPGCITFIEREYEGEERWKAIGAIEDVLLLVVVHTYRQEEGDEIIRIISARRATRHERKLYAEAIG
jgi:uncharacterized DUF497 family protein